MKLITKYLFYLLAFTLPFGSVNPFNLSSIKNVDGISSEQMGITPVLLALCFFFALLNRDIFRNTLAVKKLLLPLIIFFVTITMASTFYSLYDFPMVYLLKLLADIAAFYILSLFFIRHINILDTSLKIYAYTCVLIVLAFFAGFLNSFLFYSNGRLWIFGINPNNFSFLMGFGALIIADSFNHPNTRKIEQMINIVSIVLIVIYIIMSGSRGTFLTVLACMFVVLYKKMKSKFYIIVPIVVICIFASMSFYYSHQDEISLFERLSEIGDDSRTELIHRTLTLYAEKPIIGYGVNGFNEQLSTRYDDLRDSHNVIITNMGMSGTIGAIAYIAFLFYMFRVCWSNRKRSIFGLVLFADVFLMSMKTGGVLTFAMMWYAYAAIVAISFVKQRNNHNHIKAKIYSASKYKRTIVL